MNYTHKGKSFRIRGVNLGSWFNLEDFMLGLEGTDWQIRRAFAEQLGQERADAFFARYADTFINQNDIRRIAALGFNMVRLPFNYRNFESDAAPFTYPEASFERLDRLYDWCADAGLLVMLDFHAAPRGQNTTPPADSPTGYSELWQCAHSQDRVVELWKELARRYAGHSAHFGYDLLNEPMATQPGEIPPEQQLAALHSLYRRLIREIRSIDPEGWLIIEAPVRECGGVAELDKDLFKDERSSPSYHHYPPFEDSLSLGGSRMPANADLQEHCTFLREKIAPEIVFSQSVKRPMLLGEFGLSARWDPSRATTSFEAQLHTAEEAGFSWMLWTYKDLFRLGLFTPSEESPWFRFTRGPKMLDLVSEVNQHLSRYFDQRIRKTLPECASPRLRDMAFDDMRRGQNRLILYEQVRQLADMDPANADRMPDDFSLENCVRRSKMWNLLEPWLQS